MILQMGTHHFGRGKATDFHRGRRRQRPWIGSKQIASGRQHVAAAACRGAGRSGCDAAAVESGDQRSALGCGAITPSRIIVAFGSSAVNMLAVFNGEILEIAQPGIDLLERFVRAGCGSDTGLTRQAATLRRLDDQAAAPLGPPAVSGGGKWPMVTPAMRRLACAASPGLLTMNG